MSGNLMDLGVLSRANQSAPGGGATASGHVVVPRPRRNLKTRVLLPAALLAATASLFAYAARDTLRPARDVRVVPVVVRTVQETSPGDASGASAPTVQAPGWVEPDPFPVSVSALTDGVVKEVLVVEGQPVKAGQVVVRLIDDDAKLALSRAEADLAAREGERDAAAAALTAARRDWDNPVERTRAVQTAEAMVAQAKAELDRLPVDVEAEQARLDELSDLLRRTEANVARNAVGEGELVQVRLRTKAQQATLASTKAKRPLLAAKVQQQEAELAAAREAGKLRVTERKALDEAEASLRQAEAAVRQAAAARDEARLRLERTEVRSPADGVVMTRRVEPGSKLMLGSDDMRSAQAVRLYDPHKLQVRVDVPIADASRVGVGQVAQVVVGVLPDRTFGGVVTRAVDEADIQRNTVQFKVAIKDPSPELKPEMLARVRFSARRAAATADGPAATASQRVFAPERLLQLGGPAGQARAWVVDTGHGTASLRTVSLGEAHADGWVAVLSGLRAGDVVISGDTSALAEGARVRITGEDDGSSMSAGPPAGGSHGAH
jgi:RND family efflux transporter MFP subunit